MIDVVIPARNEEAAIGSILAVFKDHPDIGKIIVSIDPDTRDSTYTVAVDVLGADNPRTHIIMAPQSGKGQVVRVGLNHVTSGRVIFCDADITGLTAEYVSILADEQRYGGQVILVPEFPVDVPPHVIKAWPWVSGQRSLPTWVALQPELHGYLMEVQLNLAVKRMGLRTRFVWSDTVSPYNMSPIRLHEMERDRVWGMANGLFNASK